MNIELKTFIIRSGKTQREIARAARMLENRLSSIVRGWTTPRDDERARLMRVLGCSDDVFAQQDNGGAK